MYTNVSKFDFDCANGVHSCFSISLIKQVQISSSSDIRKDSVKFLQVVADLSILLSVQVLCFIVEARIGKKCPVL